MPKALLVEITAKPDSLAAVEDFLRGAVSAAEGEPDTRDWYALRFDNSRFAIFDTFDGQAGRLRHLAGSIGRGLMLRTLTQFEGVPDITSSELVAARLPAGGEAPRVALLARIEARMGQGRDLGEVLVEARGLAAAEPGTLAWYALRIGPNEFAVLGFFADEAALAAHATGTVAALIGQQVGRLLDAAPQPQRAVVLASKRSGWNEIRSAEQQMHPEQSVRIAPEGA